MSFAYKSSIESHYTRRARGWPRRAPSSVVGVDDAALRSSLLPLALQTLSSASRWHLQKTSRSSWRSRWQSRCCRANFDLRAAGRRPASRARLAQGAAQQRLARRRAAALRAVAPLLVLLPALQGVGARLAIGRAVSHVPQPLGVRAERRPLQGLVLVTRKTKRPRARHTGQRVLARESRYIHTRAREGGGTGRGEARGTLYGGDGAPGRRPRLHFGALHLDLRPPFESASSSSRTRCSRRSTTLGSWRMSPVVRRAGASMRSSAVAPDWE